MNNDYDSQLLDEFLLGRLDEAGRRKVEERASQDPAFAAEIETRRTIIQGIALAGEENLRKRIAGIDAFLDKEGFFPESRHDLKVTGGRIKKHRFLWAASIVLLISLGLWLFIHNWPEPKNEIAVSVPKNEATDSVRQTDIPQPQVTPPIAPAPPPAHSNMRFAALAQKTYRSTAPDFSNIRSTDDSASVSKRALEAFSKGDFRTSLALLDTIPVTAPVYWQAAEIRAHALFRLNQIGKATQVFRKIAESRQLPFSEHAEWFLLVCYGADYPRQKANFKLLSARILADRDHQYYDQTKNLVAGINESADTKK